MFDNDYVLVEKVLDSSSMEVRDSSSDDILSRLYSDLLKKFMEGIPNSFSVSGKIFDNSSGIYSVLDSEREDVKDSSSRNLEGKGYLSGKILDSRNNAIDGIGIFVTL